MFMGPLGWLFVPVTAVRSVLSFGQAFLNVRLGKKFPVEAQNRVDWALVGGVFAGAYVAVGIGHVMGTMSSPVLYVPLLLPFSVLQGRMTLRSYRAAELATAREAVVIRLEDYRRAERGEVRAA